MFIINKRNTRIILPFNGNFKTINPFLTDMDNLEYFNGDIYRTILADVDNSKKDDENKGRKKRNYLSKFKPGAKKR